MIVFFILLLLLVGALVVVCLKNKGLEQEARNAKAQADAAIANAEAVIQQARMEYQATSAQVKSFYEEEARKIFANAEVRTLKLIEELEGLREFASLQSHLQDVRQVLADALVEAEGLRAEAAQLVAQAKTESLEFRGEARNRARELMHQAENFLAQATNDAGKIMADAEKRALEIGGDAYVALREKETLSHAIKAMENVVSGYGDRYIIPTHSLLDDLAADFGHTEAGERLKAAREQSKRMVVQGQAATCEYSDPNRRATAIRFVVDAFNGRVDAILSRAKHSNHGTLEQEIRDSHALVNLNGEAFRKARINTSFLDARLDELRWAVVAQELRLKEREEQRLLQEKIREEEKARREYERAIKEAAKDEELLKHAMEKARAEAAKATEGERAKFEAELAELQNRLVQAEAKSQRALSMAQQTRIGYVYIISNTGSFGEEVFKIGMTRRLEPLDRVRELGDASVPFSFDVHAMIYCEDAPALERLLHTAFDDMRINKVNYRKEFFRLPLERLRTVVAERGLDATFTMLAEAKEYRETMALEKMSPAERQNYRMSQQSKMLEDSYGE